MLSTLCGCKVNQYETNAMKQQFIKANYEIVDFEEIADIYIINTCTVTNMSDRKSRQIIRRAKSTNPNGTIVVTGCYAQINKEELEKISEIDYIFGNSEKNNIVDLIEKENKINVSDISNYTSYEDFGITTYTEKTRAVVKVEDGCNNFCTYCIIPYAKGRVRSRSMDSVLKEIKEIASSGVKEVVITGIHVASYGKDFKENIGLIDLLEQINKIDNLERIRLGSLEPNIITPEFVERLKKVDKICNHFHLSLQSGCDETLKRMNRKYTIKDFSEKVSLLRENFEDVSITTDIIVGFPGETDEEFEKTYQSLKELKLNKMHIFQYSQRNGTLAAKMPNQIDPKVKEIRSHRLIALDKQNETEYLQKCTEKTMEVLFEEKDGEYYKGHTTNYFMVKVKGYNLENKIKMTNIRETHGLELIGELRNKPVI